MQLNATPRQLSKHVHAARPMPGPPCAVSFRNEDASALRVKRQPRGARESDRGRGAQQRARLSSMPAPPPVMLAEPGPTSVMTAPNPRRMARRRLLPRSATKRVALALPLPLGRSRRLSGADRRVVLIGMRSAKPAVPWELPATCDIGQEHMHSVAIRWSSSQRPASAGVQGTPCALRPSRPQEHSCRHPHTLPLSQVSTVAKRVTGGPALRPLLCPQPHRLDLAAGIPPHPDAVGSGVTEVYVAGDSVNSYAGGRRWHHALAQSRPDNRRHALRG